MNQPLIQEVTTQPSHTEGMRSVHVTTVVVFEDAAESYTKEEFEDALRKVARPTKSEPTRSQT